MVETALGAIASQIPNFIDQNELAPGITDPCQIPCRIPVISGRQRVAETFRWKTQNPTTYREREHGYIAALKQDMSRWSGSVVKKSDFVAWAKRFLRIDRIIRHLNSGIDVDRLLENVDVEKCPATKLWFSARPQRIRAGHDPQANDVDDWMFLPCVPYCDVVLTDGAFRDALVRGDRDLESRVFSDPRKAVGAIERLWRS